MEPILRDFPIPIITPRLLIRPPIAGEGEIVNTAILDSIDILVQYMPWARFEPSVNDTEEFLRQGAANWILRRNEEPYLPLLVFDKQTQDFIGAVGYHHWDWDVPKIEIGYWQNKVYLGNGYMTEAVNAMTRYAFEVMGVSRCTITCEKTNERSKKIAERLNYSFEATLKSSVRTVLTNELSDTLVYAKYDLSGLPELAVSW